MLMLVAKWQEYRELAFHDCAKRIIIDDNRLLVEACKDRHGLLLQLTVKIECILPPQNDESIFVWALPGVIFWRIMLEIANGLKSRGPNKKEGLFLDPNFFKDFTHFF